VADYLAMRRGLGFKLKREGILLPQFVAHLESHGARAVTRDLALSWSMRPADGHPAWWSTRLMVVRGFARYLHAFDPRTAIPPAELLPGRYRRSTPHLYSEREIAQIFEAARRICGPLRAATLSTIVGLLATAGLRIGEAIRLDREDVDWQHGVLLIRKTKFGKSRQVPLHESTMAALKTYARFRDRLFQRPITPAFFVSKPGTRLWHENLHRSFQRVLRSSGIKSHATGRPPRFHDLRHTFAVRTLVRWYASGRKVDARLPLLSTYLGHNDPAATYWYLSASPELLALAARRLERAAEVLR
jgi:integrase